MDTEIKNAKAREHYSHAKADARKEQRYQAAMQRKERHDSLSTAAKIKKVKSRPGENKRELARLMAQLEAEKAQKSATVAKVKEVAPAPVDPQPTEKPSKTKKAKSPKKAK
jgi:hypothetical protein